jgi:L-histidine N-alpha-methyltransferase
MNFTEVNSSVEGQISIEDCHPCIGNETILQMIVDGLTATPRHISSMFFYDAAGSKLFERITALPEYYPSRTERQLLKTLAPSFSDYLHEYDVVELGSGDCSKISILFDAADSFALQTLRYIPVDVSRAAIEESARSLVKRYPGLIVRGIVADFLSQLSMIPHDRPRLFFFLGSTIGNLSIQKRLEFFAHLSKLMTPEDRLLLGIDMVKPRKILETAYNDSSRVTAEFNKNILKVINSLAATDFESESFEHVAFYNEQRSCIEMHLQATRPMVVTSPALDAPIHLGQGERIHTEDSHKFTIDGIAGELTVSGLTTEKVTTDRRNWFSLVQVRTSIAPVV